jgi:hypothetical protein
MIQTALPRIVTIPVFFHPIPAILQVGLKPHPPIFVYAYNSITYIGLLQCRFIKFTIGGSRFILLNLVIELLYNTFWNDFAILHETFELDAREFDEMSGIGSFYRGLR